MNRIFYLSNLLDGDYFYERKELKFDLKRSVWNYFQFFVSLYSFLFHIIIFITDNEYLKHELPTLRMFEDVGERISNMAIGASVISLGSVIIVYKEFHRNQSGLDTMRFLFCFDERKMKKDFHLNSNMAKKQISFQKIFIKGAKIWHQFYFITLFLFVFKLAIDNLSKKEFGIYYLLRILLYLSLAYHQQAQLVRACIIFGHMNLSCIYFHHYLQTLNYRMQKLPELKGRYFDVKLMSNVKKYNQIIKDQYKINNHFGRVFYFFHVFNFLTVIFPCHILSIDPSETFLIAFDLSNYFNIIFLVVLPVIVSNIYFTRSNLEFMRNCYSNSAYLTKINSKIKMLNIYTLNYDWHSISFNFKNCFNYSLYFFIFCILESISLVVLFYATVNVLKK